MATFFSKVAQRVTAVISLNRHFVFCLSCVQTSMISFLLTVFCIVVKSALVQRSIDFFLKKKCDFHDAGFSITQHKSQGNVVFAAQSSFSKT